MADATRYPTLDDCRGGLRAAEAYLAVAERRVGGLIKGAGGRVDAGLLEQHQLAAHGYAWLATYVAGLRETLAWAERLEGAGKLRPLETHIVVGAFAEYLNQMAGGIALSQGEFVRPLYTTGVGLVLLATAGMLLALGSFTMSRMVKVEV